MLKLTLANGAVVEIGEYEDNAISNRESLSSVFSGTSAIFCDDDGEANVDDMDFDVSDDDDLLLDGYIRVKSAEWCFAESGFDHFVQGEMNRYCEDGADWCYDGADWCYDVIHHGCASGCVSSLIYTSDCLKVLREHYRDIQAKIDDLYDNIGEVDFLFRNGFTFDRLVWMCFEETVRDVLLKLELDDV